MFAFLLFRSCLLKINYSFTHPLHQLPHLTTSFMQMLRYRSKSAHKIFWKNLMHLRKLLDFFRFLIASAWLFRHSSLELSAVFQLIWLMICTWSRVRVRIYSIVSLEWRKKCTRLYFLSLWDERVELSYMHEITDFY